MNDNLLENYLARREERDNRSFSERIEATLIAATKAIKGPYTPCEKNGGMCTCGFIYALSSDVCVANIEHTMYNYIAGTNKDEDPVVITEDFPNMSKEQQAAQMAYFAELDPEFIMKLIYSYKLLQEYAIYVPDV